jgi:hypothetical protein
MEDVVAKRTGKTRTVGKKVTRKPSRAPSTIVTAAQTAGSAIGRAVNTAVSAVEGMVGVGGAKKKQKAKQTPRKGRR